MPMRRSPTIAWCLVVAAVLASAPPRVGVRADGPRPASAVRQGEPSFGRRVAGLGGRPLRLRFSALISEEETGDEDALQGPGRWARPLLLSDGSHGLLARPGDPAHVPSDPPRLHRRC